MALKICDMHSHLLPGIDDGAQDMEETMQALQEAYRQGIRAVIATPHYYPEHYETEAQTILDLCRQVKSRCRQALAFSENRRSAAIFCFYRHRLCGAHELRKRVRP